MEVGLGPGHIVLDGAQLPHPRRGGHSSPSLFGPCLWPNGWMDQGATWYGDGRRPRRRCVRWGPSSTHGKGHISSLPTFRPTALARSPISAAAEHLFFSLKMMKTKLRWKSHGFIAMTLQFVTQLQVCNLTIFLQS